MFFFFNDTATTEIYTLSLHDALPILTVLDNQKRAFNRSKDEYRHTVSYCEKHLPIMEKRLSQYDKDIAQSLATKSQDFVDRKSTRLNSSHANISYAVFCLKKKNNIVI